MTRRGTETLVTIQALRAFAAAGVALAHTGVVTVMRQGATIPYFGFLDAGVDLFFVISGFIMVYTSERLFGRPNASQTFFVRRLIRIVPLYWLVTTVTLATAWFRLQDLSQTNYTWTGVLASYFFVPYPTQSGAMIPLVGLGWTLNYEMFFYVVFATAVVFRQRIAVFSAASFLVAFVVVGRLVALPPALRYLSDPIVLEFVFGMAIAVAYRDGLVIPKAIAYALIALGIGVFGSTAILDLSQHSRVLVWGLPLACVMAGFVFAIEPETPNRLWRGLSFLGDSSYSLYLVHGHAMLIPFLLGIRFAKDYPLTYTVMLMAVAIAAAVACYLIFERPVTQALRRLAVKPSPAAKAA
jgi:peptidoglycan/LPS O-acetylase OafA/YrhL